MSKTDGVTVTETVNIGHRRPYTPVERECSEASRTLNGILGIRKPRQRLLDIGTAKLNYAIASGVGAVGATAGLVGIAAEAGSKGANGIMAAAGAGLLAFSARKLRDIIRIERQSMKDMVNSKSDPDKWRIPLFYWKPHVVRERSLEEYMKKD